MNNNEIVAAAVGVGVGGSAELVCKSALIAPLAVVDENAIADRSQVIETSSYLNLESNECNRTLFNGYSSPNTTSASLAPIALSPITPLSSQQQKVNSKWNDKFHELFPSVPIDEHVIDTYSCAYTKSLNLYQGILYLTSNFICFHSKFLNHIIILKFSHINSITKSMHAVIFPTAIRIETRNAAYSFTSFLSRSNTLDHLAELWKQYRQRQANQAIMCKKSKRQFLASQGLYDQNNQNETRGLNSTSNQFLSQNESSSRLNGSQNRCENAINQVNDESSIESVSEMVKTLEDEDDEMPEEIALENIRDVDKLKRDTISPYYVNKSLNDITGDRIVDQFRLFKPGSLSSPNYYDYCYSQQLASENLFYDFDFSNLSKNMVTVSLRHRKTLLQKVKILMSILIPGFFNISRIDALLPICFIMCVLLLLNAFVLLNKVNQVDEIFTKLLTKNDY